MRNMRNIALIQFLMSQSVHTFADIKTVQQFDKCDLTFSLFLMWQQYVILQNVHVLQVTLV